MALRKTLQRVIPLRSGHENCADSKISKRSGDRRWWHQRQDAGDGAERAAKISVGSDDDAAQDGEPGKEGRGRLEVRLYFAGLSRTDHQRASASRTSQPGARVGGIRLSKSVWPPGKNSQRCRHASGWQLQGRTYVISRIGHGAGIRNDRRRNPAADGASPSCLQKRKILRGLSWPTRAQTNGQEKVAAVRGQSYKAT